MKLAWTHSAWNDYLHWQASDKAKLRRVNALIKDIMRSPFEGIGDPEPLKHNLSGYWSRRIDREHRLVYKIEADDLVIAQCRYHYGERA